MRKAARAPCPKKTVRSNEQFSFPPSNGYIRELPRSSRQIRPIGVSREVGSIEVWQKVADLVLWNPVLLGEALRCV